MIANNEKAARQASIAFAAGTGGYLLLGIVVWLFDKAYFDRLAVFLFAFVIPSHLIGAAIIRKLGKVYLMQWILLAANIFSGACVLYIGYLAPLEFILKYGYGLVISINLYSFTVLRMRFFFASVSSTIITLCFVAFLYFFVNAQSQDFVVILAITMFINAIGLLSVWFFESTNRHEFAQSKLIEKQSRQLEKEKKKSEELLLNILPRPVADRLLSGESTIADLYNNVSVLFADIEGFTSLSREMSPEKLVSILNSIFSEFDEATSKLGLEKIKTIGDSYMAAAGLPMAYHDHADRCVKLAHEMISIMQKMNSRFHLTLRLRIGISSGPVVAGVIGKNKFIFDLWGDTVNTASRMESSGLPGEVHITDKTRHELGNQYNIINRGEVEIKGIGRMPTFLVQLKS